MILDVTKNVLAAAQPKNTAYCMYAIPLRLMGASSVNITAETIRWNKNGKRHIAPMPAKGTINLQAFDKKGRNAVKPHRLVIKHRDIFSRPVELRGPQKKGKHKKRRSIGPRRCSRRYHGLKIIEIRA